MELFLGILIGLVVLVVLIVLHELGHAIVARRNGVIVEEFGIGFPPRAWKKRLKNGILFSLNWLPLGGFVRLKGEHDSARGEGTYGQASFWVKTKILFAGVAANWLSAALLLSVMAVWGIPRIIPNQVILPFDNTVTYAPVQVYDVTEGSPADKLGLEEGDIIQEIGDVNITTYDEMRMITESMAGETVTINFSRADDEMTGQVALNTAEEAVSEGYLGVRSMQASSVSATWSAPILGVATAGQLTYETVTGLGSMLGKTFTGFFGQFSGDETTREVAKQDLNQVGASVAGPLGILGVIFPSVVDAGFMQVMLLAAIISLTLAVMNLLPIPALDGGRWFTMAIFRLFKKELTKEREENIQAAGFLTLMILMVLVTWSDVGKIF